MFERVASSASLEEVLIESMCEDALLCDVGWSSFEDVEESLSE